MSQPVSQEDLNQRLINELKDLRRIVESLRSNQNQVQEIRIPGHPQHTDRWTTSDSYEDVVGSEVEIDFDKYSRFNWRFLMTGYVDGGTGFYRLINVTAGGTVVPGSEISTTQTSPTLLTSDILTKPSGVAVIKIQHKQTGGDSGDFVNSVMSAHLFSFD